MLLIFKRNLFFNYTILSTYPQPEHKIILTKHEIKYQYNT